MPNVMLQLEQSTHRRGDGVVATVVGGRITQQMVTAWTRDYERIGGAQVWLFDAMAAKSYAPEAVATAVELFARQKALGLHVVIAAIRSPLVRMGASVVKMGLRMRTGIEFCLFETLETAENEVKRRVSLQPDPRAR
jgi:hypothetical protein